MNTPNKSGRSRQRGRRSGGKRRELLNVPKVSAEAQALLQKPLAQGTLIVFDIETTGGNPEKNGITEIFAIRYRDGEILGTFYSMVNPGIPIPPIVRRMTGINNQMVRNAPRIEEVMPDFLTFVGGDVLVSHNTIGDMKFLRYFAKECCAVDMENFYLCTHLLVEKLAPETPDKSLKGLAQYFALSTGELHRAEADAYVTLSLFKVLFGRLLERGIERFDDAIRLQGDLESGMRLGWGLDTAALSSVPPGPGVFSLFDHQNKPLFISGALQLNREVGRLKVFDQLPRQLLRLVLKASDIKVSRSANGFAAMLEECAALETHAFPFLPIHWHQRTVQAIFLAEDGAEVLLGIGPIPPGTTHAFGPVRDRRLATELLDALAEACGTRHGRHGVRLPKSLAPVIVAFFSGLLQDELQATRRRRSSMRLWFNPKGRQELSQVETQLQALSALKVPPRLAPILEMAGLIVVPEDKGAWQVHHIIGARPTGMTLLTGDPEEQLWQQGQAKTYASTLARDGAALKPAPLTSHEANKVNATLWWIYNGKFEGRFLSLSDLSGAGAVREEPRLKRPPQEGEAEVAPPV